MPGSAGRKQNEGVLTIGAVSRATGVPVETLRTWERRYGFPQAIRRPSGHRRYPLATVPKLRRVVEALERGHRPADILALDEGQIEHLLNAVQLPATPGATALLSSRARRSVRPEDLRDAVISFDGPRLQELLEVRWRRLGPVQFLERCAAPFLRELGDDWESGALGVRHEHFGSSALSDFLRGQRRVLESQAGGPWVALSTLPGDRHEGGLMMAAVVFAAAGWQLAYLGADTPLDQIASLAHDTVLAAVAVSVSPTAVDAESALTRLHRSLPQAVELVTGGSGLTTAPAGATRFEDLVALAEWARLDEDGRRREEAARR